MWSDTCGRVGKLFSLTVPLMLVAGGPVVDFSEQVWVNSKLQAIADGAALAGAREISMSKSDPAHIQKIVLDYVNARKQDTGSMAPLDVQANVAPGSSGVTVVISKEWNSSFSHIFGINKSSARALATAHVVGNTKVCALSLMDNEDMPGVQLADSAKLSATDCGVYSNSKSANSVLAAQSAKLEAHLICAAGGTSKGLTAGLSPVPMTDCKQVRDPLAHRAAPAVGRCMEVDMVVGKSTVLFPGTYCGGLTIKQNAWVGLQPGVYVMKDGPLLVEDEAELSGQNVSFHLDGENAVFDFSKGTKINLSAPQAGPLAGLLFYETPAGRVEEERNPVQSSLLAVLNIQSSQKHRGRQADRLHRISSSGARKLVGTFYLPNSSLQIDAEGPVADKSAYTAIVVRNLKLLKGPHLVLNTNYGATNVPVPRLIAGGDIRLSR
ncbi:MAG: pilus assembly protein [Rhizobiales bacterium]|nr:pilus assembly protein [Hyphomicrobiales bacterium]